MLFLSFNLQVRGRPYLKPNYTGLACVCCRYEHALSKANYASLALRPESRAEEDEGAGLDEDEDLYQSLNK